MLENHKFECMQIKHFSIYLKSDFSFGLIKGSSIQKKFKKN